MIYFLILIAQLYLVLKLFLAAVGFVFPSMVKLHVELVFFHFICFLGSKLVQWGYFYYHLLFEIRFELNFTSVLLYPKFFILFYQESLSSIRVEGYQLPKYWLRNLQTYPASTSLLVAFLSYSFWPLHFLLFLFLHFYSYPLRFLS